MRVASNDSDDRAGLRGYVQFNKYTYILVSTQHHRGQGCTRFPALLRFFILVHRKVGTHATFRGSLGKWVL